MKATSSFLLSNRPTDGILNRLFQEDFSLVRAQILKALACEPDKNKLFGIVLCEHFKEIKECENINLKIIALKNVLMALDYLGNMSQAQACEKKT